MELKNVIKTAMVAFALGVASPVGAADYYVATNGNDANAGTSLSAPFRTILKGMEKLKSGDALNIRAGEYNEGFGPAMPFNNSAATSWDQAIRIAGYPGETVVIKPLSGQRPFLFASAKHIYIILDNLILDGAHSTRDTVKITWSSLSSGGSSMSHHIWIKNSVIKNAASQGVLTSPGSEYNIFTNLDVFNNGFRGSSGDGTGRLWLNHGLYLSSANNIVECSRIHGNAGWGVDSQKYSTQYGTQLNSNNIVRNNLIYNNAAAGQYGAGIGLYRGMDDQAYNLQAIGNIIWGNYHGIDVGGRDSIIRDNIIYLNKGFNNLGNQINFVNTTAQNTATLSNNTLINAVAPSSMPSMSSACSENPPPDNSSPGDTPIDTLRPSNVVSVFNPLEGGVGKVEFVGERVVVTNSYVVNLLGQKVKEPLSLVSSDPSVRVEWDGRNNRGEVVASGVYTLILEANGQILKQKMVVVK